MGFLAGKRLLITGLLSNRSIAYGIAKACKREWSSERCFRYSKICARRIVATIFKHNADPRIGQ